MQDRRTRRLVLYAVVIGAVIRLALAYVSLGTNDALIWEYHARRADAGGALDAYRTEPLLNHPPLAVLWARLSLLAGEWFTFVMKLPAIAADTAACALAARVWLRRSDARRARRAAFAVALSPVAILISGYHCNTDSVYAFFSLLAAYALVDREQPALGGIALGMGINTKILAALLVPAALVACRTRRDRFQLGRGLAIMAIPLLSLLVVPGALYRNMLSYRPRMDRWGVGLFLHEARVDPRLEEVSVAAMSVYRSIGPWIIVGAVVLLCVVELRWRRWDAYELFALTFAIFLLLTPGFGVQYTVMVVPLLATVSISRTWIYGVLCGLFLSLVYWTNSDGWQLPLVSEFPLGPLALPGPLFGLLAWWVLLDLAVHIARHPRGRVPTPAVSEHR